HKIDRVIPADDQVTRLESGPGLLLGHLHGAGQQFRSGRLRHKRKIREVEPVVESALSRPTGPKAEAVGPVGLNAPRTATTLLRLSLFGSRRMRGWRLDRVVASHRPVVKHLRTGDVIGQEAVEFAQ